jgi:hypothetical protein
MLRLELPVVVTKSDFIIRYYNILSIGMKLGVILQKIPF